MIKTESLGMIDVAKVNPVIKSESDVVNYSFLTVDNDVYLISNTITGDDAYKEDVTIPAGDYLNGFLVKAWEGQKLVIDEKHIKYGEGEDYAKITPGTTVLKVDESGKLAITASAPTSGVYFIITDKTTLTGKAVKARVIVAVDTGEE